MEILDVSKGEGFPMGILNCDDGNICRFLVIFHFQHNNTKLVPSPRFFYGLLNMESINSPETRALVPTKLKKTNLVTRAFRLVFLPHSRKFDSETSFTRRSGSEIEISFSNLRSEVIGIDETFVSPFGKRLITYADFTASGRALRFIENYLTREILPYYGNTHTEDVYTGLFMTKALAEAEALIKRQVRAGENGKIIACGNGSTGAINKFQQLIGIFIPPATKLLYENILRSFLDGESKFEEFEKHRSQVQPVVFVGPYEHHSNEISWRQGLAEVVEVNLGDDGSIDLKHLEELLNDEKYKNRLRIGSFSAASNVTGMITETKRVAKLLHQHNAFACFDFAASAPYVDIDMSGSDGTHYDAIYMSPHKLLGGPGSSGILVFNEALYNKALGKITSFGFKAKLGLTSKE